MLARRGADDELVGYHLEHAYLLSSELAPPGPARATPRRGRGPPPRRRRDPRVEARAALAASNLLSRSAAALLPTEDEERRELLCELGIALNTAGETERADETLREATEIDVPRAGDRRIELRAQIELAGRRLLDDPRDAAAHLLGLTVKAIPILREPERRSVPRPGMDAERLGTRRCALPERRLAGVRGTAPEYYRRAGWPPATCVGHIAAAAYFGPTPVQDAIALCENLLDQEVEDRAGEANTLAYLGGLVAMRGDRDEAAALVDRSRSIYADLGSGPTIAITCAPIAATIQMARGDVAAAEQTLRESIETLEQIDDRNHIATPAGLLADALCTQLRFDDAHEWTVVAELNALPDDAGAHCPLACGTCEGPRARGPPRRC